MHEIFGPYQLIERIASGGMAEIFKARTFGHSGFEKTLVIKRLHPRYTQTPEFVEMLKEEAKTAVGLSHANIVQIFDLGRVQEHYYIAMEYINGRDLRQVMNQLKDQRAFIPPEAALYLVSELCSGLDFAHRKRDVHGRLLRLIHRDVSPHNIMISAEGEVKVVDFGIAKSLATHQSTEAGVIKGKFCFMSPEQAQGARLDHRTDVFSAGILLYELLTGRPMYASDDDHQLLQMVRHAQYAPIEELRPDLPRALHKVVNKALAADRDQRYPSARHFQHGIEKVMQRSGLMFSRFQLSRLVTSYFPQIEASHEQRLNQFEDFEHEEHSLISDYEVPSLKHQNAGTGWEVPELVDELEDLSELDELEDDELTDPGGHSGDLGGEFSLSRKATPVPISITSPESVGIGFAPAAPPPADVASDPSAGRSSSHLYDPKYDAPAASYGASMQPVVSSGDYPHNQVTQPPRGVPLDQRDLYSSESPNPYAPSPRPNGSESHQYQSDFGGLVESTMILGQAESRADHHNTHQRGGRREDGRGERSNARSAHAHQRSGRAHSSQVTTSGKLQDYIKRLRQHPQSRYIAAGVGFLFIILSVRLGKSIFVSEPTLKKTPAVLTAQVTTKATSLSPKRSTALDSMARKASGQDRDSYVNGRARDNTNSKIGQRARFMERGVNTSTLPLERRDDPVRGISLSRRAPQSQVAMNTQSQLTSVQLISDPDGADVAIDDEWQDNVTTPFVTQLNTGKTYFLVFSKIGYQEKRVQVIPQTNNRVVKVSLTPQLGRLMITSEPTGALIRVNGKLIGETPLNQSDYPLSPAEFEVEVSKSGYESKTYDLRWNNADRGTLEVNARLEQIERVVARVKKKKKRRRRRKPARAPRPPRSSPSRPRGQGFMSVKGASWGELFVDGRFVRKGKVILKHKVSAGRHRVKFCFNGNPNDCRTRIVNVGANDHMKVFF